MYVYVYGGGLGNRFLPLFLQKFTRLFTTFTNLPFMSSFFKFTILRFTFPFKFMSSFELDQAQWSAMELERAQQSLFQLIHTSSKEHIQARFGSNLCY
jgi:hypothetical protein